jgi:hypothetical protein
MNSLVSAALVAGAAAGRATVLTTQAADSNDRVRYLTKARRKA